MIKEYLDVFSGEDGWGLKRDAVESVKEIWGEEFWLITQGSTKDGSADHEKESIGCALLVIMNCLLGNSTPAYDCSIELRAALEKTELGRKINLTTEYALPLPRSQWGDLSTNPDTESTAFDIKHDISKVVNFIKYLAECDMPQATDEYDIVLQERGRLLRNYLERQLEVATTQQSACLEQIQANNLADDVYKGILETDSPLVIIYKDLLAIVDTLLGKVK